MGPEQTQVRFEQVEIAKLELTHGDIIVLRTSIVLSEQAREHLMESMALATQAAGLDYWPPVIVLDQGMELEVLLTRTRRSRALRNQIAEDVSRETQEDGP